MRRMTGDILKAALMFLFQVNRFPHASSTSEHFQYLAESKPYLTNRRLAAADIRYGDAIELLRNFGVCCCPTHKEADRRQSPNFLPLDGEGRR
jgi:hypothetical protein